MGACRREDGAHRLVAGSCLASFEPDLVLLDTVTALANRWVQVGVRRSW